MAIPIAPLPYSIDSLEPIISATALKTHYEEHYKSYVKNVNELVQDTVYQDVTLKDIVLKSGKKINGRKKLKFLVMQIRRGIMFSFLIALPIFNTSIRRTGLSIKLMIVLDLFPLLKRILASKLPICLARAGFG